MTSAASMFEVTELLSVQLAAFEALLLLASGLHKLIRQDRARTVIHEFAGVPRYLAPFTLAAVVATELLASVLLWIPSCRAAGAVLAAAIWAGYLLLILRAIADGRRDVDCGCSFGAAHSPLGVFHLVRNLALTSFAILVAVVSVSSGAGPITASQILVGVALLALYGALDQVMGLQPPRTGELL
jgi:hypothetical protein